MGVGKTALMNKLKNDFKDEYVVIYMDLSLSDKYQKGEFTREAFMELLYKELINACTEFGLKTIDKKIENYVKIHDIKLIKEIISYENVPVPIPGLKDNYSKLASFVMDLPQKIHEEYEDKLKGVFIFIDEFQIIRIVVFILNKLCKVFRIFAADVSQSSYVSIRINSFLIKF